MKISVLTPTCDRPVAFALLERYMRRQTVQPFEWIVADGGAVAAPCTMGQVHVHTPRPPGAVNFAENLLAGLARATGDAIIVCEDDDLYFPDHIASLAALLERFPLVGSEPIQRYYNVAARCWRTFNNIGASLCQTGFRRELFPAFERVVRTMLARNAFGVDTNFWRSVPKSSWGFANAMTVVGIKGVPGRAGLGVGHRPAGPTWVPDPDLRELRALIGDDAETYAPFYAPAARAA